MYTPPHRNQHVKSLPGCVVKLHLRQMKSTILIDCIQHSAIVCELADCRLILFLAQCGISVIYQAYLFRDRDFQICGLI